MHPITNTVYPGVSAGSRPSRVAVRRGMSACLPARPPARPSVRRSVRQGVCASVRPSVVPPVCLSGCPSFCLSVCLGCAFLGFCGCLRTCSRASWPISSSCCLVACLICRFGGPVVFCYTFADVFGYCGVALEQVTQRCWQSCVMLIFSSTLLLMGHILTPHDC